MLDVIDKNVSMALERNIIGTLLNNPQYILEFEDIIKAEHFHFNISKELVVTIRELVFSGRDKIDSFLIVKEIEKSDTGKKALDTVGGFEYIELLKTNLNYSKEDLVQDLRELLLLSFKRRTCVFSTNIVEAMTCKEFENIRDLSDYLQNNLTMLVNGFNVSEDIVLIGSLLDRFLEEAESVEGNLLGYPSVIGKINEYTLGYRPKKVYCYSAQNKVGKSLLLMNEAINLAVNHGVPVLVLDTEMDTDEYIGRCLAHMTQLDPKIILTGKYKESERYSKLVKEAVKKLKKATLIHIHDTGFTPASITNLVRLMQVKHGIEVLIYDYIKMTDLTIEERKLFPDGRETAIIGYITQTLKKLASKLEIPVITACQSDQFDEYKVADSSRIKRLIDMLAFLVPKKEKEIMEQGGINFGDYRIRVEANRGGDTGDIDLLAKKHYLTFQQSEYQVSDYS